MEIAEAHRWPYRFIVKQDGNDEPRLFPRGQIEKVKKMSDDLRAFVRELAKVCWDGGSLDGGDLQAIMVKHKLLAPVVEIEPCSENCFCREEYGEEAFPVVCFKLAREFVDGNNSKPDQEKAFADR